MATNDQVILRQILDQRREELAPELAESEFFELFSAEQILKDIDLSWDEIESGIVANGGDGGIDGLFLLVNRELVREDTDIEGFRGDISIELHVVQAKTESGFSESAIQKLKATIEDILDLSRDIEDLKSTYNSRLTTAAAQFRRAHQTFASRLPNVRMSFYYSTIGAEVHPNVQGQVKHLKELVLNLFSDASFTFDFLGARELLALTRRQPRTTYQLKLSDSPISTVSNSYIGLVSLQDYFAFITDEEGNYIRTIFEANVRDHQGDIQVNRGIRETLGNPKGEDFWWLNNGVSILASKAVLSAKTLTLENPQIVNGLQTSLEIYKFFSDGNPDGSERTLLIRVIVPEVEESYERIVRATNSQTAIPVASLRSIDKIHRDIEDFFKGKGLYYDRRKNQYKNEGKPIDSIISITYVAQAVMAIALGRPNDARARPSTLLKNDDDYVTVFNPDFPIDAFLVCTHIMRRVEAFFKSAGYQISRKDINNLKFHIAMFATRVLTNKANPKIGEITAIDLKDLDDDLLNNAMSEVWQSYRELGEDDQVAKSSEFVTAIVGRLGDVTYEGRLSSNGHS